MNNSDMVGSLSSMLKIMDEQCDIADYSHPKIVTASAFLTAFVTGFLGQIFALPATWRLAKKRSALLIMFHADLGHCLMLSIYIAICLEYFLLGHRPEFPVGLDGFYFSLIVELIGFCYVLLALNRFVAVFLPTRYDRIFSGRRSKLWICACWLMAIVYSAFENSKPELRPYHCVNQLVVLTVISSPEQLDQQSTYIFTVWTAFEYLRSLLALLPMALYFAVFMRMIFEHCQSGQSASSSTSSSSDLHHERARLFLISLLSTLPFFLQTALSHMLFLFGNPVLASWSTVLYNVLFTLFQLHQPFLLYWLSADFRKELHRDIKRLISLTKTAGDDGQKLQQNQQQQQMNPTNNPTKLIVPISRQQAWN